MELCDVFLFKKELCDVAVLPSACVYVDDSYALPTVLVEGE